MADLSRMLAPLEPPPGGAFRLSERIAARRPRARLRPIATAALAAALVAMLWSPQAPLER